MLQYLTFKAQPILLPVNLLISLSVNTLLHPPVASKGFTEDYPSLLSLPAHVPMTQMEPLILQEVFCDAFHSISEHSAHKQSCILISTVTLLFDSVNSTMSSWGALTLL